MIKLSEFPHYSESFLRQPCNPVETEEEALEIKEALMSMFPKEGAYGIAAPQIGIHKQAFIAHMPSGSPEWLFACNPRIVTKEEPFVFMNEACLSFPKKSKNTDRYRRVIFTYDAFANGVKEERKAVVEDDEAVIIQHEVDHLNNTLYFDHAISPTIKHVMRIGRNDPCPCNSGKKYKKCCLDKP